VANTKSAEKANRQSTKHRARNSHANSTVRTSVRKFRETLEGADAAAVTTGLKAAVREIAKAASKGIIHKSQAARRISRLSKAAHAKSAAK
jgi:small subunit ribosomal protein S20